MCSFRPYGDAAAPSWYPWGNLFSQYPDVNLAKNDLWTHPLLKDLLSLNKSENDLLFDQVFFLFSFYIFVVLFYF